MKNSSIKIVEVKSSFALNKFIKFPYSLYKNDKAWVPPLLIERKGFFDNERNPFFKHADVKYFLAYKNGKLAGRIAGIINHNHNSFHNEKCGFFGHFECIEDDFVAYGLLDRARMFAKESGMNWLRGPMNFSTNDETGLLVEGFFHPPSIMMTYNPPYYEKLFEKFGLKKKKDLFAYYLEASRGLPERMVSLIEKIKQRFRIYVRPFNSKNFDVEVAYIKDLYNKVWEKLWGFVPMTDDEFNFMAKQLKQIYDPDLLLLAFVDSVPVGFSLALPNINEVLIKLNGRLFPAGIFKLLYYTKMKKIIRGVRVITMGIIPQYQKRGIDNIFYNETFKTAVKKGYRWGELSWVLEDNELMNRAANLINAKLYKKYRIYEMDVY